MSNTESWFQNAEVFVNGDINNVPGDYYVQSHRTYVNAGSSTGHVPTPRSRSARYREVNAGDDFNRYRRNRRPSGHYLTPPPRTVRMPRDTRTACRTVRTRRGEHTTIVSGEFSGSNTILMGSGEVIVSEPHGRSMYSPFQEPDNDRRELNSEEQEGGTMHEEFMDVEHNHPSDCDCSKQDMPEEGGNTHGGDVGLYGDGERGDHQRIAQNTSRADTVEGNSRNYSDSIDESILPENGDEEHRRHPRRYRKTTGSNPPHRRARTRGSGSSRRHGLRDRVIEYNGVYTRRNNIIGGNGNIIYTEGEILHN